VCQKGEGPKPHDVRDRLGVPALGEHADGDDVSGSTQWVVTFRRSFSM
jgi:hypothetical protein